MMRSQYSAVAGPTPGRVSTAALSMASRSWAAVSIPISLSSRNCFAVILGSWASRFDSAG